jgi:hypothetical protein
MVWTVFVRGCWVSSLLALALLPGCPEVEPSLLGAWNTMSTLPIRAEFDEDGSHTLTMLGMQDEAAYTVDISQEPYKLIRHWSVLAEEPVTPSITTYAIWETTGGTVRLAFNHYTNTETNEFNEVVYVSEPESNCPTSFAGADVVVTYIRDFGLR